MGAIAAIHGSTNGRRLSRNFGDRLSALANSGLGAAYPGIVRDPDPANVALRMTLPRLSKTPTPGWIVRSNSTGVGQVNMLFDVGQTSVGLDR